jgi:hypothetical protein
MVATCHQRRKEMARAHAKRASYCTCGKVVHGNGGEHMHREMHKRKGDGHYYMTYTAYCERKKLKEMTAHLEKKPFDGGPHF